MYLQLKNTKNFGLILITLACMFMIAPLQLWAASPIIDIRISSDNDDSEEKISSGAIDDGSSDLELGQEGSGAQLVGLRFPGVPIPAGATITNAYILFTTDEEDSNPTSLTIQTQDMDNAPAFTATPFDISDRTLSTTSVAWNDIPAWNTVGENDYKQQTPDISILVQEMVDRPGWAFGNPIVFIISGTGERTAESFDSAPDKAALLHIEYSSNEMSYTVAASNDDAREQPCSTCSPVFRISMWIVEPLSNMPIWNLRPRMTTAARPSGSSTGRLPMMQYRLRIRPTIYPAGPGRGRTSTGWFPPMPG
jgi:hypothetical protein